MEFHKRGSFPPVTGYRHNENFDLEPGTFTDDTSLTLCLAQSLVDKGFDVRDQVSKYLSWCEHGYMSGWFNHLFVPGFLCYNPPYSLIAFGKGKAETETVNSDWNLLRHR